MKMEGVDDKEGVEMISIDINSQKESKVKTWIRNALKVIIKEKITVVQVDDYLSAWNGIFFISSLIGISFDPFILYFPIINEENKCLGLDKTLLFIVLSFRSFTDLFYLIDIIYQIHTLVLLLNTTTSTSDYQVPHQDDSFPHEENNHRKSSSSSVLIELLTTHNPQLCDLIIDILSIIPVTQVFIIIIIILIT